MQPETIREESLSNQAKADIFKKMIELLAPDLRSFYPTTIKGKIEKVYTTDNVNFHCDVQPLNNDETVNEKKNLISKVQIPVMFAGPDRGIIAQPIVGLLVDITYYDGDEDFPAISNLRYSHNKVPHFVLPGELLIQKSTGNFTKFKNDGSREEAIPGGYIKRIAKDVLNTIGGILTTTVKKDRNDITRGDHTIDTSKKLTIKAGEGIEIKDTSKLDVNTQESIKLVAGGSATLAGTTTQILSEDSMTLMSTGPMSLKATSLIESYSNASLLPETNTVDIEVLLGNYKINCVAGLLDIGTTVGTLKDILIASIDFQIDILDFADSTQTSSAAIIVSTAIGPSSPPTNASEFVARSVNILLKIVELNTEKAIVNLIFV